jgi:hypothetical protein
MKKNPTKKQRLQHTKISDREVASIILQLREIEALLAAIVQRAGWK